MQVTGSDVNVYNFAMAHLRTLTGIELATPQQINPGGTSYVLVKYHGDITQLAAALSARGWTVETSGTVLKLRSSSDKPPALPPPPQARPAATAAAAADRSAAETAGMKQGPDQIALPLDWPQTEGDARFIVSDANREAFDHFRKWSLWPVKATILTGPRRSGRTPARPQLRRAGRRPAVR